jgi:hypothetical protein
LLPLLPALVVAAPAASSAPSTLVSLTTFFLVVASKSITATESKRCGRETVREVDLSADGVGEVGDDEDILDVCVAAVC